MNTFDYGLTDPDVLGKPTWGVGDIRQAVYELVENVPDSRRERIDALMDALEYELDDGTGEEAGA